MSDFKSLVESIDSSALAERLLEFVRVESPTGSEGEASRYYARYLEEIGLEVTLSEAAPGRSNVLGRLPGSGGGPTLVFNGHLDTIPRQKCVSPEIREGKVWGRGSEDMKGGLVAAAEALRCLKRSGIRLKGDIYIAAVVGHETPVGKKEGPLHFAAQIRSRQISPDAIIILEGPRKIWAASLGYGAFTFRIRSRHPSVHTFTVPLRANPLYWMGEIIWALDVINEKLAKEEPHPLCGRGFINLGMLHGGDYPTRLAGECALTGTWSWTPQWSVASVRQELERLAKTVAERSGLEVTVEMEATREPFETSPSERVVIAMRGAERQLTGQPSEVIGMALVSDAHIYRNDCKIPTIYYGPTYATAHSDQECLSLADLTHLTRLCALTATEFCHVAGPQG